MSEKKWSREKINNMIRRIHKKGEYMDSGTIVKKYSKLYSACYRFYGGWYEAVEKAGIDPHSIKKHPKKTPKNTDRIPSKFSRLLSLLYYISNYPGATGGMLADILGVSKRTIARYLKELRNIPGLDVVYIDKHSGYDVKFEGANDDMVASRYLYIWTSKDMRILEYLVNENVPDEKIAQLLGRTVKSIQNKKFKMNL